jgi:endonuclease III
MTTALFTTIHTHLTDHYGTRTWRPGRNGLDEFVLTILSQSTTDRNSGRAYVSLRQRYPTWHDVADAPIEDVALTIRVAGLAQDKAERIHAVLTHPMVMDNGYSIDFLCEWSHQDAQSWLIAFKGVGPKTASCVLMFAYGMPLLPVDTHIQRVAQRVGLVIGKSPEHAHNILNTIIPADLKYEAHMHLIQLGRQICHARNPICARCPLFELCPTAQRGEHVQHP